MTTISTDAQSADLTALAGAHDTFATVDELGSDAATAIATRAAALTAWMDGVRIMPRFPTPLQRELSA